MRGFRAEPVAVVATINAGLTLAVVFGVDITDQQQAAIIVFTNALLALFLRGQVTSEKTAQEAGTSGRELARIAEDSGAHMVAVVNGRKLQDWERPRD